MRELSMMFDLPGDDNARWTRVGFILVPFVALLTILVIAVQQADEVTEEIEGTEWNLEQLRLGDEMSPAVNGSTATLTLAQATASGFGGCNTFTGDYTLDGDSLRFAPLASTLLICDDPPGAGDQEVAYFAGLSSVDAVAVVDGALVLSSAGSEVLVFSSS